MIFSREAYFFMNLPDRYLIAETEIGIVSPFSCHREFCRGYESSSMDPPELIIEVTPERIAEEIKLYNKDATQTMASLSYIYRSICAHMIKKGGFVLHAAVIEYGGLAYAFLAPSGTGKSTHIKNWKRLLGDEVKIVNGDKPIIIQKNDGFYACGTPWAGKEKWQRNTCVKLGGFCKLSRGDENKISPATAFECFETLLGATLVPEDEKDLSALLDTLERITAAVPACKLYCTPDVSSAKVSSDFMTSMSMDLRK